ncbi:MAG: YibE/F family protein, partial [Victivallales bacterium]|nr:YibE/F family protein [Victivallales bacterium]
CLAMCFIPSPPRQDQGLKARGLVLEVDDSNLILQGRVKYGAQKLMVNVLDGKFKGRVLIAANELRAQLELDKVFSPGDKVRLVMPANFSPDTEYAVAQDFDRTYWSYLLFGLFCALLCIFGGWVGLKALFSFYLSCLVIWKCVIPLVLRGFPASPVIFVAVAFLTAAIIFLVAGLTKKGLAAFLGGIAGVFAGLFMAWAFTCLMHINGAVMPYSQTLLFSGYENLNLQDLFAGAMILASSGAVMDLAMDIAAGVGEVALHSPDLGRHELIASGLRMGRSVVGTMTTTLLLAYSGGYITLLMMFCAQGNSLGEILNNPLVASEVVKTLIGSFSLVLVAPFTAFFAGYIFSRNTNEK